MDTTQLDSLSNQQLLLIAHVLEVIDEQYQMTLRDKLVIDMYTYTNYTFTLHGNPRFTDAKRRQVNEFKQGLEALQVRGVVTSWSVYDGVNSDNRKLDIVIALALFEMYKSAVFARLATYMEQMNVSRFWLDYDNTTGWLTLNGVYKLRKLHAEQPSELFIQQVFASPNELIAIAGIPHARITKIIDSLRLKSPLREMFFPKVSNGTVLFRPSVSKADVEREGLTTPDLSQYDK